MPLALTVFGVAGGNAPPVCCYAFLRPVRGPGDYPPPNLPSGLTARRLTREHLTGFNGIDILGWDQIIHDAQAGIMLEAFAAGKFSIPSESPIDPGRELVGELCEPSLIFEYPAWVRASGSGILWLQSVVLESAFDPLTRVLAEAVGADRSAAALSKLIDELAISPALTRFFCGGVILV